MTLFAFRFGRMVRRGFVGLRRRLLPAIHLAPESAFQGPPGHISSRGGADLCPSSAANPSRQRYKAHSLARWFSEAGMTVLTLFAFRFGRMVRRGLVGLRGARRRGRGAESGGVALVWRWFGVGLAASRRWLFPAIHLARQSPFYGTAGHISSRDGIDLCPSSVPNPARQHSKAHSLARWFAGRTPTCHTRPSELG